MYSGCTFKQATSAVDVPLSKQHLPIQIEISSSTGSSTEMPANIVKRFGHISPLPNDPLHSQTVVKGCSFTEQMQSLLQWSTHVHTISLTSSGAAAGCDIRWCVYSQRSLVTYPHSNGFRSGCGCKACLHLLVAIYFVWSESYQGQCLFEEYLMMCWPPKKQQKKLLQPLWAR